MRGAAVARRLAMLWTCRLRPVAHEFVRTSRVRSCGSLAAPVSPEWPIAITPVGGPDGVVGVARAGDSRAAGEPPPPHATAVTAARAAIVVAVRPRVAPTSSPCGVDAGIIPPF